MRLETFRAMVRRLSDEIPSEYLDGIAAIEVSPRTVPHPVREGVYTLGECIPLHADGRDIASRVVLYHGSFQALAAEQQGFDWQKEARDTLHHEVRHHLEWRANSDQLEAYDWAAEQNFRRQEGLPFDPLFYQAGDRLDTGVFRVDDDVFLERVVRGLAPSVEVVWRGRRYHVEVPGAARMPLYLVLEGVADPPEGDLVLVLRRRPRLRELFRRSQPAEERHVRVHAGG